MMKLRLIPAVHRVTHAVAVMLASRPELGVMQGEAHVLAQLAESDPVTPSALLSAFGHKPSTLTSILDRLVDRGLVRRTVGAADRRTLEISLTRVGRQRAQRVVRALQEFESTILAALPAADRRRFLDMLASIDASAFGLARDRTSARPAARSSPTGRRPR